MGTLSRYTANDLDFLMDAIEKTSIGLGPTLKRLDVTNGTNRSYPPYNIIKNSEENWEIEMALAGWDKDDIDFLGILKIDILALGMLTCIKKSFDLIENHHNRQVNLNNIQKPLSNLKNSDI